MTQRRSEPTELGGAVDSLICEFFLQIINIHFTVEVEGDLDKIEESTKAWVKVADRFYKPFKKELTNAEEKIEKIQIKDELTGSDCGVCGYPMVIKLGKYGELHACSNFPDCRNTKPIIKEIGVTCPVCHEGQAIEWKSKKSRLFYGCSRFSECESVSWNKPVGRNCPKCDEYLVGKKIKSGKQVVCVNGDYEEDIQE